MIKHFIFVPRWKFFNSVVVFQLPPAQLQNALNRTAALRAPLVAHVSQPEIRSSLPRFFFWSWSFHMCYMGASYQLNWLFDMAYFCRSILAVLGIASDSQTSSQAQTSQARAGDASNSDKEAVIEKSKESSTSWHANSDWRAWKIQIRID